ncbi:MAG: DUF2924 domain-containing protein [Phycisphaerales bacterium]|nr:DUF2924 domain-containing protein [Phycisphaerales bacterium]
MRDLDAIQPSDLPNCSLNELHALWRKYFPRQRTKPPPKVKQVLIREIAWTMQERQFGGLDAETKRLLNAAIRAAEREGIAMRKLNTEPRRRGEKRARPQSSPKSRAKLQAGTKLIRRWHGRTHEVVVLADSHFEYRGKVYSSLSEIARLITGTQWSGPRFFGVTQRSKRDGSA